MRRILALAFVIGALAIPHLANAVATASAPSLLIPPGARADGMGRAHVALAEGPTSVWWNTGGLAFTEERSATLMHTKLVPGLADDVYYEYLGGCMPLEDVGGVALNIIYLTYGKSQAITAEEVYLGEFRSYEWSATGGIGFKVNENLGFGAALKVVYVMLAPAWATPEGKKGAGSSFGVDLGVLYRFFEPLLGNDQLNLAVVITNIGPKITFIDAAQASPMGHYVKLGVMYAPFITEQYAIRLTYDFDQPTVIAEDMSFFRRIVDFKRPLFGSVEEPIQHFGGEAAYTQGNIAAAVRLGYVYDPEGTIEDWTFGLGVKLGQFGVDWAMSPQAQTLEENVHKFSVTVSF